MKSSYYLKTYIFTFIAIQISIPFILYFWGYLPLKENKSYESINWLYLQSMIMAILVLSVLFGFYIASLDVTQKLILKRFKRLLLMVLVMNIAILPIICVVIYVVSF